MEDLSINIPTSHRPSRRRDWHNADIVAAVRKKKSSLVRLSLANGLHRQTVQAALHRPYARGENIIAAFLGLHPAQIWPRRFNPNGSRKTARQRGEHKPTRHKGTPMRGTMINGKKPAHK